ncbi:hypothetical protein LSH36_613g01052 [Paralvinella palmiformis]|uniref:protein-histidine N-methyltransferase n=1 Tax=Paralvinella palmiformis TaxID=53620 RepID=A0AAD9J4S0_9ANNE|nr:hypothetical protein LSH36_613g01052 [Paralvinella palmiformis]
MSFSFNFNIEEQNTEAGDGCHTEGRVDEMEQSLKDKEQNTEAGDGCHTEGRVDEMEQSLKDSHDSDWILSARFLPILMKKERKSFAISFARVTNLLPISSPLVMSQNYQKRPGEATEIMIDWQKQLGCGAGLPGLYAFKEGAQVTFQDYNPEVFFMVTAANILLNKTDNIENNSRLIAGDWSNVQEMLSNEVTRFDYILTSETIYSSESYKKLHDIMTCLIKPEGVIYLAAKTCYFGVGGGMRDFEDFLDKEDILDHIVCKECVDGVQREILKLTLKKKNNDLS